MAELVGRWVPTDGAGRGALQRPFVDLAADGTYTGSDGCNGTHGRWSAGPGGELDVALGPSTRMACEDMVAVPYWFAAAARTRFDDQILVLIDAAGADVARLERDPHAS